MSVAEARTTYPDKIQWIYFPSVNHLENHTDIEETKRRIIAEAAEVLRIQPKFSI